MPIPLNEAAKLSNDEIYLKSKIKKKEKKLNGNNPRRSRKAKQ